MAVSVAPRPEGCEAKPAGGSAWRKGAHVDCRERLSPLVLETVRERNGTARSQTLGKAVERRMLERKRK